MARVRRTGALRAVALGAVAVGVAAPLARRRLKIPRPVVSALAWQAPFALAVAVPRSRTRELALYGLQMAAYVAHYEMPNDDGPALMRRMHVRYPISADRWLGGGVTPTVWLQRRLGRPGEVRLHDTALSWIHWSWFFVPHGSLLYIHARHPGRFARSAAFMAGVFDLGLVGYWALPTAPPWWAGKVGEMPPVRRIMVEAGEEFWGDLWRPLYDALGGNPFAAMPSLHFATSAMAAHVLSDAGPIPGAIGWAYTVALGFALVYLGEHYVVDLAAGLALTEAVRRLGPATAPLLDSVGRSIARLEAAAP